MRPPRSWREDRTPYSADAEEAVRRIEWHHAKDADVSHGKQTDIALAIASSVDLLDQAPFFGSSR